ncbi:MAG: hypothetical protein PVJ50_01560 [Desulfobacterales bacterium]|jgi:hypothetical protein
MERKSLGRGLDDISNMCLSPRKDNKILEENADHGVVGNKTFSDNTEPPCEIEENVSVRRNIAYPNTSNSQQNILKSFSRHLEENYSIKRIELRKTDRMSRPGMKKCIQENITIFIQGGADHGNHS